VKFLLYSAEVETEGLIYASSQFHWRGDGKGTRFSMPDREYSRGGLILCPCTSWRWTPGERYIDDAVEIYAKVYPNLRVHDRNYRRLTSFVRRSGRATSSRSSRPHRNGRSSGNGTPGPHEPSTGDRNVAAQ
jgi:hypothetical protein